MVENKKTNVQHRSGSKFSKLTGILKLVKQRRK